MISSVQTKRKEGVPFIEGTPSHCIEKKLYYLPKAHFCRAIHTGNRRLVIKSMAGFGIHIFSINFGTTISTTYHRNLDIFLLHYGSHI